MGTQIFSTSGSFNWTCPAGVTSVTAECVGAGGRGGAAVSGQKGSGGGGGAYARSVLTVVPGTVYGLIVGAVPPVGSNGGCPCF